MITIDQVSEKAPGMQQSEGWARMVNDPANRNADGSINWDFVSADLHLLLGDIVDSDVLDALFEAAADIHEAT